MLQKVIATSLALRSAAIILLILAVVGTLFVSAGRMLVAKQEHDRHHHLLGELLTTVERTISIAVFLSDEQLAKEVANGLVQNSTVRTVSIRDRERELAFASRASTGAGEGADQQNGTPWQDLLVREISSPFEANELIGQVVLEPNHQEIIAQVERNSGFVTLFFLAQLAAVALSVVAVVISQITRPITQISRRLHALKVETGEKLAHPGGNKQDEIGTLVSDVNTMIDYLVNILGVERRLRQEREVEEKKFRAIVDNAETGIFQVDSQGRLSSSNPAFRRMFAVDEQALDALTIADVFAESHGEVSALISRSLEVRGAQRAELELSAKGGPRWFTIVLNPVDETRLQGVANDITESKLAEAAAEQRAVTDALTGIGNRLGFERRLQWQLDRAHRYQNQGFSLVFIDLDRFKAANDHYGHQAGDKVLTQVSTRLQQQLRKSDYVARLGGDEFAVILEGASSRDALARLAEKIISSVGEPVAIDDAGTTVSVGASVGIAISGEQDSAADLVRCADRAMYDAKHAGRNTYRFYG